MTPGAREALTPPRVRFDRHALDRLARDFGGYFLVSLIALGLDYGLLLALHYAFGWDYLAASALSFSAGIVAAWLLSASFVFKGRRRLRSGPEFLGFLATGVAGLVLNQCAIAALVGGCGIAPAIAKIPVAGLVFTFNFVSRRTLLFTPRVGPAPSATGSATDARHTGRLALGLVAAGALFLLTHAAHGISGDALIYAGRALADLDPAGIGQDAMFRLDGQSQFSLYTPLARILFAALPPAYAANFLVAMSQALWLGALGLLAWRVAGDRFAWLLAFVAILPSQYGPPGLLAYAEPLAEPRPFAEAFVLFALSAWLPDKRLLAAGLLALAALFHPIMAMAGFAALGLILIHRHVAWRIAAPGAVVAFLVAAWAGFPIADRALTTVDADWLALLQQRNPYLFPDLWPSSAFALIAVQAITLVLAMPVAQPRLREIFGAALAASLLGLAAAWFIGALWPSLLGLQLQFWRMQWLAGCLSAVAFGLCLFRLGPAGPRQRVALALLTLGWLQAIAGSFNGVLLGVLALALSCDRIGARVRLSPNGDKIAWLSGAALVCTLWLLSFEEVRALFAQGQPDHRPWLMREMFVAVQEPVIFGCAATPLFMPAGLSPRAMRAGLAAVLAGSALWFWDDSSIFDRALWTGARQGALIEAAQASEGEVLWVGGLAENWMWLGKPNWAATIQGAGMVFSRDLAAFYGDRGRFLTEHRLGFLFGYDPARPLPSPTGPSFRALCARTDAPVSTILPLIGETVAPADWKARSIWTAPSPKFMPLRQTGTSPVRVARYAVVLCEDHR